MTPGPIATSTPIVATLSTKDTIPRSIFPDGIKTSGQHPPSYEELKPYSEFPSQITGPTLWDAEDYKHIPDRWTHHFTSSEISELSAAAEAFKVTGTPLTGITKENFRLPRLSSYLDSIRDELLNGRGFILFKNFPVQQWGNHKSAIAYMGLGTYLGYFVSQNGKGHVLGHVKDLGEDAKQIDKVRIYRTNARQYFHTDWSDIVGLLCVARALEGGESDICSSHQVYNMLKAERPDVLETLTKPIWYFDRKGEVSKGEEPYIRTSVFYLEQEQDGASRVYCKYGTPAIPVL
jgi:Taurine catabolism dioxygenase TauD, TfdA family